MRLGDRFDRKATTGLAGKKLIMKLRKRKRVATGSRNVRICTREEYPRWPHPPTLPPSSRDESGDSKLPLWGGENVLRTLQGFDRTHGRKDPKKLETRARRRSAARAITQAGGSVAWVSEAARWHVSADRLYVDLGRGSFHPRLSFGRCEASRELSTQIELS